MDAPQIEYREKLAEHLIKQLTKRRWRQASATTAQAREEIVAMIPEGATVSRCGSCLWWRWGCGRPWEKDRRGHHQSLCPRGEPGGGYALMRRGLLADL